jgi:hypothetical protein
MKFQATLAVDVEFCDEDLGPVVPGDPLAYRIEKAVSEGILNALKRQEGAGFNHEMDSLIAITIDPNIVTRYTIIQLPRASRSQEQIIAEQATGCVGSGDYGLWADGQGYLYCVVLDWTSSAGDWQFIVSKDGEIWYVMTQENNFPRLGYTRTIDESRPFEGTEDEALDYFSMA